MPNQGNSFRIVLGTNMVESTKAAGTKRKMPDRPKEQKKQKKGKYERKQYIRNAQHDNGLFQLSEIAYQTNSFSAQAKFMQEVNTTNPILLQALSGAFSFNESLSFIRSNLRKENAKAHLKKSLTRLPFNQNQSFSGIAYKPGSSFVRYQNNLSSSRIGIDSKKLIGKVPEPNFEVDNAGGFVCAGCKRSDTKKYAKNLCQTCYKRQKRYTDGTEEQRNVPAETIPKINEKPEPLPIPNKEWTGTCPDCKRSDVKHYAKGRCTACYRKIRNRIKREAEHNDKKLESLPN